jgi:hypothetical protein
MLVWLFDHMPQIDHKNGDGLDNRKRNLRPATHSQNQCNTLGHHGRKCAHKGVTQVRGRFRANITVGGRQRFLGSFADERSAAQAYAAAAQLLHGPFARTNFEADETDPGPAHVEAVQA